MSWWNRDKTPKSNDNQSAAPVQDADGHDAVEMPQGTSTDDNTPAQNAAEGNETMLKSGANTGANDNAQPPAGAAPPMTMTAEHQAIIALADEKGIKTSGQLSALIASAALYDNQVASARTEAKARATTLYASEPNTLAAELAIIDGLPAGVALDHHLGKLNAAYDAEYETTASGPAKRVSAPNSLAAIKPKVAADATGASPVVEPTVEQKQKAADDYQAGF